jgi:hypothetical protein
MKKLLLLLSLIVLFSCSSNDDNQDGQTFLERHNGIVWETSPESNVTYVQRFMFTNNPTAILSYFEDGGSGDCTTIPIGTNCSDCYIIIENNNNTLSIGSDVEVISTFTVSGDGLTLSYDSYDDGICNKTNLTEICN